MYLPLGESPLTHNEGVVHGEAVNLINSEGLHLLVGGLVSGKVGGGAGGGEGSWKREDDGALSVSEVIGGGNVLPVERILIVRLDTGTGLEGYVRDGGSLSDGGGVLGEAGAGKGCGRSRHDGGGEFGGGRGGEGGSGGEEGGEESELHFVYGVWIAKCVDL